MSEKVEEIENMKVCLLFLLEETIYLKFICIENYFISTFRSRSSR